MIGLSFVVIAYNEAANIGRTLDSITSLEGLDNQCYEIIVVNDGSRDTTAYIVAERAALNSHIKQINLQKNRGRGYARSAGIAAAKGDLIATVDADIILPSDWFVRVNAALAGHDAVAGTAVPDGDVAYVYRATRLVPRIVGHTITVTGSNALYRRKVFELIGFDSTLREGEDVALNWASALIGLSFHTVPGLIVEHAETKTLLGSLRWLFTTGKGATRQLIVYRQVRTPDLAAAAFMAGLALGIVAANLNQLVAGAVIPVCVLSAVSIKHVHNRFETPLRSLPAVSFAVALDGVHLLAYFAGRIAGLSSLFRRRQVTAAQILASGTGPVSQV